MKLIHTADWHLGNRLFTHDRTAEFQHFLAWMLSVLKEEQPDALLISGDIFDSSIPSADADKLYYDFLTAATEEQRDLKIIICSGNHDSPTRLEAPSQLLELRNIFVRGIVGHDEKGRYDYERLMIPLQGKEEDDKALCLCAPFLRASYMTGAENYAKGVQEYLTGLVAAGRKAAGKNVPLVLMAHFFATGSEINNQADERSEKIIVGGQENVDASCTKGATYTALGHIHKRQSVNGQDNIRYSGSALPMSFSEKTYHHGVERVIIEDGEASVTQIAYTPLCHFISIPENGTTSPDEALRTISKLPKAGKDEDTGTWPYLEIKINEQQPEPTLAATIQSALRDKAVRFCRITREIPIAERNAEEGALTLNDFQKITPLEMLRRIYKNRYTEELKPEFETLFQEAEKELEQNND